MSSPKVRILGPVPAEFSSILTKDAIAFLAELHVRFDSTRLNLLQARKDRQLAIEKWTIT